MIEAKRIKMKPMSNQLCKVVHLKKANSSRLTPN